MKPLAMSLADVLRALRAGPIDTSPAAERHGRFSALCIVLARLGYVHIEHGSKNYKTYHITPAGRRACPPRNPASGTGTRTNGMPAR